MGHPKTKASDFRYETGPAKVSWPAVGEPMRIDDLARVIEFLVPPNGDHPAAYRRQKEVVTQAIQKLHEVGGWATKLTLGQNVAKAEKAASEYLKVKHALFVTNATAGFEIAYKMAGLQADDEVIIPAITFVATMAYPLSIGAKVVLADVNPRTINLDPADVARKITSRTRMIVPVHVGGWPVDMAPIMRLAKRHDLVVLEDAAHAFGASYRGRMAGTIGHFGAYSFHEVKNINAFGEGGLLVSNTKYGRQFPKSRFLGLDLSLKIPDWLYDVTAIDGMRGPFVAGNHSATEIQAVGLRSQMQRNGRIIAARRRVAETLNRRFAKVRGLLGAPMDNGRGQGNPPLVPAANRPGRGGRQHSETETETVGSRSVADRSLRPALSVPGDEAIGLRYRVLARRMSECRRCFRQSVHPLAHLRPDTVASQVSWRCRD